MPLTIDLYGDSKKQYGFLIIDRDNLIFQFLPNSTSEADMNQAMDRRNNFKFAYHLSFEMKVLSESEDIDDPRHFISDHLCEFDTGPYHTHLKFSRNIDLDMMLQLIDDYPEHMWLQNISRECYAGMRGIVKGYFQELTSVSTLSPSPADIESQYQAEKNAAFELKTDQLKLRKPLQLPASIESKEVVDDDFSNSIISRLSIDITMVNGRLYMGVLLDSQLVMLFGNAQGAAPLSHVLNIYGIHSEDEESVSRIDSEYKNRNLISEAEIKISSGPALFSRSNSTSLASLLEKKDNENNKVVAEKNLPRPGCCCVIL